MSIVQVIVKSMQDREFCELLFSNKEKALSQFKLNEKEVEGLKKLDRRTYDKAISEISPELKKRITTGSFEKDITVAYVDYPVVAEAK